MSALVIQSLSESVLVVAKHLNKKMCVKVCLRDALDGAALKMDYKTPSASTSFVIFIIFASFGFSFNSSTSFSLVSNVT